MFILLGDFADFIMIITMINDDHQCHPYDHPDCDGEGPGGGALGVEVRPIEGDALLREPD